MSFACLAEQVSRGAGSWWPLCPCSSPTKHVAVARQNTWAYASVRDVYPATVLQGLNFCMFSQQLAVVKAQSFTAFSDAWSHSNLWKVWSFRHCHFPEMIQVGISPVFPFFRLFSAHCDFLAVPSALRQEHWHSEGSALNCRIIRQLSTLCQDWREF